MARRPNIVLILADDLGFSDLGCYGGEIATPNLDRLAAGGMRFTHFYNNAVCVATRASLLTGQYCHKVGQGLGARLRAGANNVTFAELLRDAGYRTLMAGKWHSGQSPGELPLDRGFDRHWGLVDGGSNYFNPGVRRPGEPEPVHKAPGDYRLWGDDRRLTRPFTPEDPDFYITDACSDRAVSFLDRHGRDERPFLLYLAYTAPHFPLHAPEQDIARYQGRYLIGWDELRRRRHARLCELGLVEERWGMSERDARCGTWEQAPDKQRWDRKMAVYAAMVDRMDRGIGRVLDKIRELGEEQDTLVLFLSDNGGCGEQHRQHTGPRTRHGRHLHHRRRAVGHRQQHAVPQVQGVRPRGRHSHPAHRLLAGRRSSKRAPSATRWDTCSTSCPRSPSWPVPSIPSATAATASHPPTASVWRRCCAANRAARTRTCAGN